MKTCEEMAQSVMVRAKAYKRRKRWIMSTSAACICCLILGIVMWGGPKNDEPVTQLQQNPTTTPHEKDTPRITFLSAVGKETVSMRKDVKLPVHMEIRQVDWRGMTEEEKEELVESETAYAESVLEACGVFGNEEQGYHYGMRQGNTLVTSIVAGHIVIGMDDPTKLESIYLETGGNLQLLYVKGWEGDDDLCDEWRYYMDSSDIVSQYYEPYGGIAVSWMPDSLDISLYDQNPPVDVSKFSDTITIAVTFMDGTVEEHRIDIVIAEDGQTGAIYRGQTETV